MINMTQFTNTVADNTVVVNGATFKVADDVALKVLQLISGIESNSQTVSVSNVSKTSASKTEEKTPYVATRTSFHSTKSKNRLQQMVHSYSVSHERMVGHVLKSL